MSKFINLYDGGMMPLIDGNKNPDSKVNNNNNKSEKSENNNQKKIIMLIIKKVKTTIVRINYY